MNNDPKVGIEICKIKKTGKMERLLGLVFIVVALTANCATTEGQRQIILLDSEWKFINKEVTGGEKAETGTSGWETVSVPHDWAISGEFDEQNDVVVDRVVEDGEKVAKKRTGRTGGLPHVGVGWYRKVLDIPAEWKSKNISVEFDGAMSHARVFLNGGFIGEWPYGYASFGFDLTGKIRFGQKNILAVRLGNPEHSSRWYPGAGIYRNVRLVITDPVHVKRWGTFVTTPGAEDGKGTVTIATTILSPGKEKVRLQTDVIGPDGTVVATTSTPLEINGEQTVTQSLTVKNHQLWSTENPVLYKAVSKVLKNGKVADRYETPFGFRFFEFTTDHGFSLNGENMKLNGVCLHHDLGPLGAAVNYSALKRQLILLREMGCNAIRTSHNPPAPELLQLTDEMGFLVIDEAFDEWKYAKVENGYHTLWDQWAEKDLVAMIRRDRNHPSVIMWSLGNEIREQGMPDGAQYCRFLADICKREDSTRPTTAGFNNWEQAIRNGLAAIVDVPGWNYKPQHYSFIHEKHPDWKMYASETASTVSSRGEYFLPAEVRVHYTREPYHSSAYDLEYPGWATTPDREFAAQDSFPFMAGEFVWTGFDYLGEPTPYNEHWPSHSSYFGIIDLCGIPKDRYFLYQSKWSDKDVLHLLPHWNWEGKEGELVPVHCYTSFRKAELFLNGKSQGIREKDPTQLYRTYRLVWDVPYEPGALKVVALDESNRPLKETTVETAGAPAAIRLGAMSDTITADGKELAFVTVSVVDKQGVLCPRASNRIRFKVEGAGSFRAVGNGDPTSLESFVKPAMKAFNGKCVVFLQSTKQAGQIRLTAEADGLEKSQLTIATRFKE